MITVSKSYRGVTKSGKPRTIPMTDDKPCDVFNLGTERGASIKDIIERVQSVTNLQVPYEIGPRRPGDPARLIASHQKAHQVLGWKPEHDLDSIVTSAWDWFSRHPSGYDEIEPESVPDGRY